jgi:hypothetical protein
VVATGRQQVPDYPVCLKLIQSQVLHTKRCIKTIKFPHLFRFIGLTLAVPTLAGCLTTLESGAPNYYQEQTPLQQVHSILDIQNPAQRNAAGLEWFRNSLSQMDAMVSAAGMDPRALEYETFYQQSRERGAQPIEADWEARKDMRNMEIFRQGGIPPNF